MRPFTQSAFTRAWLSACFTLAAGLAQAADLFADPAVSLLRTETFAAEAFGGYLTGTAREHVYNVPGDKTKLSQLDWTIDHAFVVGGRATVRPMDWLSIRARGWMSVDGNGKLWTTTTGSRVTTALTAGRIGRPTPTRSLSALGRAI